MTRSKTPTYPPDLIQELRRHGWREERLQVDVRDRKTGQTALLYAIDKGLPVAMPMAELGHGVGEEWTLPALGERFDAFGLAIRRGRADVLSALIENDPEKWARDRDFYSALLWKCLDTQPPENRIDLMEILLRQGADPDITDGFWSDEEGQSLFFYLSDKAELGLLVKFHGTIDGLDHEGRSPLFVALEKGDLGHGRLLLDLGANPNGRVLPEDHRAPHVSLLARVISKGDAESARFLMKHGAGPEGHAKNHYPGHTRTHTPLMMALIHCPELVGELVMAGARIDAVNPHGESVWKVAKSHGQGALLQAAVDQKAFIREKRALQGALPPARPTTPRSRL